MDPLSIVSAVAAAVQFVDFSSRLFSESSRVYRGAFGGEAARIVELTRISRDLSMLSKAIDERMALLKIPGRHLSATEAAVLEVCASCAQACREVTVSVERLGFHGVQEVDFEAGEEIAAAESAKGGCRVSGAHWS